MTKRDVLATLKRDELLEAVDAHSLDDRRKRDQLIEAMLLQGVKTKKKTELLFLALFLRLLQTDGRAAVIVPGGVLLGSSTAHKTLFRILVEEQKLDAIVSKLAAAGSRAGRFVDEQR